MADITVTPTAVVAGSYAVSSDGVAGESIAAGQPLYKKASDSNALWKSQADGTAAEATCVGISLHGAADGQPIRYITSGDLNPGGTVAVGQVYVVSATAGGIAPITDLTSGSTHYVTILGVATTTSNLKVRLNVSGVTKA